MLVQLIAFCGKLKSDVMEWPDEPPVNESIHLPMPFENDVSFVPREGTPDRLSRNGMFHVFGRGEFRCTGRGYRLPDGRAVREFVLVRFIECGDYQSRDTQEQEKKTVAELEKEVEDLKRIVELTVSKFSIGGVF